MQEVSGSNPRLGGLRVSQFQASGGMSALQSRASGLQSTTQRNSIKNKQLFAAPKRSGCLHRRCPRSNVYKKKKAVPGKKTNLSTPPEPENIIFDTVFWLKWQYRKQDMEENQRNARKAKTENGRNGRDSHPSWDQQTVTTEL